LHRATIEAQSKTKLFLQKCTDFNHSDIQYVPDSVMNRPGRMFLDLNAKTVLNQSSAWTRGAQISPDILQQQFSISFFFVHEHVTHFVFFFSPP
jgi:hypothetical protein